MAGLFLLWKLISDHAKANRQYEAAVASNTITQIKNFVGTTIGGAGQVLISGAEAGKQALKSMFSVPGFLIMGAAGAASADKELLKSAWDTLTGANTEVEEKFVGDVKTGDQHADYVMANNKGTPIEPLDKGTGKDTTETKSPVVKNGDSTIEFSTEATETSAEEISVLSNLDTLGKTLGVSEIAEAINLSELIAAPPIEDFENSDPAKGKNDEIKFVNRNKTKEQEASYGK